MNVCLALGTEPDRHLLARESFQFFDAHLVLVYFIRGMLRVFIVMVVVAGVVRGLLRLRLYLVLCELSRSLMSTDTAADHLARIRQL